MPDAPFKLRYGKKIVDLNDHIFDSTNHYYKTLRINVKEDLKIFELPIRPTFLSNNNLAVHCYWAYEFILVNSMRSCKTAIGFLTVGGPDISGHKNICSVGSRNARNWPRYPDPNSGLPIQGSGSERNIYRSATPVSNFFNVVFFCVCLVEYSGVTSCTRRRRSPSWTVRTGRRPQGRPSNPRQVYGGTVLFADSHRFARRDCKELGLLLTQNTYVCRVQSIVWRLPKY
jgi:hypothetical protein